MKRGNGSVGGRPKSSPAWNYFKPHASKEDVLRCLVAGCSYTPNRPGNGANNLERHLQRNHPKEFKEVEAEKKRIHEAKIDQEKNGANKKRKTTFLNKVEISVEDIMDCMVCGVTISGRPLAFVDDPGIQWLIKKLLDAAPSDERRAINSATVREEVEKKGTSTREELTEEFKGRLLSIKADGVARMGRSFLGVNVQYIENGQLKLRTLAVAEILLVHSGLNISNLIIEILSRYNISVNQIYSMTVDNGSNMVKAAELLGGQQTMLPPVIPPSDSEGEEEASYPNDLEEENTYEDFDSEAALEKSFDRIMLASDEGFLSCVRCAAHTLHLAVGDAIKHEETCALIKLMRSLAKRLRTPRGRRYLKIRELKVPCLDCETRWCSCVFMLESLLPLKEFCMDWLDMLNKDAKKKITVTAKDFEHAAIIVETLLPAKEAMKNLQSEQLVMGGFLKIWFKCKLKIQRVQSELAQELYQNMDHREELLFSNESFVAAVYMDPRYFNLLKSGASSLAEKTITAVWRRLEILCTENDQEIQHLSENSPNEPTASINEETEDDEFEKMLREADDSRVTEAGGPSRKNILPLLKQFRLMKRLPSDTDILKFWESKKFVMPELYAIAVVVLAVPATQVSVERLFSGVKFVLSDLRYNLKSSILDDIMVIRTNHLFKQASTKLIVPVADIADSPVPITPTSSAATMSPALLQIQSSPRTPASASTNRIDETFSLTDLDMNPPPIQDGFRTPQRARL